MCHFGLYFSNQCTHVLLHMYLLLMAERYRYICVASIFVNFVAHKTMNMILIGQNNTNLYECSTSLFKFSDVVLSLLFEVPSLSQSMKVRILMEPDHKYRVYQIGWSHLDLTP